MSSKGKVLKMPKHKKPPRYEGGHPALAVPLTRPIETRYGHDGRHVLVQFSDKVANLTMDVQGAEQFAVNILKVAASLRQHRNLPRPPPVDLSNIQTVPADAVSDGKAPHAPPPDPSALAAGPSADPGSEGGTPNQEHPHA